MKEIYVVAGIIEKDEKILCLRRGENKNPNVSFKWEFAGGKIEIGETEPEALKRELREELNIIVKVENKLDTFTCEYPDFKITMAVYFCKIENDDNFNMNEHIEKKWLPKCMLKTLDWATIDILVVDKLLTN